MIEIKGYHFFNDDISTGIGTHVRDTFLKNLREQTVELPAGPGQPPTRFTMEELGIGFGVLIVDPPRAEMIQIPNPYYEGTQPGAASGMPGMMVPGGMMPGMAPAGVGVPGAGLAGGKAKPDKKKEKEEPKEPPFFSAPKYTFVLQFCWQEKLLTERLRKRQQELTQPSQEKPASQPAAPDNKKVAAAKTGG